MIFNLQYETSSISFISNMLTVYVCSSGHIFEFISVHILKSSRPDSLRYFFNLLLNYCFLAKVIYAAETMKKIKRINIF